jgi:hypothetical protein
MAVTNRLSASAQTALSLACEAFSEATGRFHAEPRLSVNAKNRPENADASIRFSVSEKHFDMPVVVILDARSVAFAAAAHRKALPFQPAGERRLMVITHHVTPKLAAKLIANKIPFLDTAGNAYLDEPEATVMITGRDKPAFKYTNTSSRSTTPKGLVVTFALATLPELVSEPYRTIADETGVALNTVNLAVDDLIARGLVAKKGARRVIADRRRFIEDWVSLYPVRLRPKLGARRFTSGRDISWWQGSEFTALGARVSGEVAADALTHEIKPATVTVYANAVETAELMKAARLRPAPHGEVEILEAFWPEPVEERWGVPPGIAHPLLIYADLIASGDSRNHSVAQTIYEQYLER